MVDTYSVPLKTLVEEFKLGVFFFFFVYDQIRLTVEDLT